MSTPVIWILFPALVGILLFFLRRWYRITVLVGSLTSLTLAAIAIWMPINTLVRLGPMAFKLNDTFVVLGRRLYLGTQDRPLLILIYILVAFWFSASFEARAGRLFVPTGLLLVSIWVAALAVEPFLYAALLLELAVLLSVPLLSPPGSPPGRGVIRYLIFQTFGMPFILLTGWLLAGVESSPGDLELIVRATALLGFGFIFLLGVFPFHSWLPMLTEEVHPYPAAFIFFFLPLMVSLFGLNFLDQYAWLRQSSDLFEAFRLGGIMMMIVGGVWGGLQRHMGRILGFAILTGTGASLLSITVLPSLELFFAMQIPRALALAVWALGLSVLARHKSQLTKANLEIENPGVTSEQREPIRQILHFRNLHGAGRKVPVATTAITLALFSFAGYPLLASFPVYQALWRDLAISTPIYAALVLFGCASLGIGGLRSLAVLVTGDTDEAWQIHEHWLVATFLGIGILLMILLGLFPHLVLPYTASISDVFSQLNSQTLIP